MSSQLFHNSNLSCILIIRAIEKELCETAYFLSYTPIPDQQLRVFERLEIELPLLEDSGSAALKQTAYPTLHCGNLQYSVLPPGDALV